MPKYPLDEAARIAAWEKEKGGPLDDTTRQFVTMLTELENDAYQQGLKEGFLKPFDQAAKERHGVVTDETPEDDQELQEELMKLREQLEAEFTEDGFDAVLNNLSPVPEDATWGEKIYEMAREAFVIGACYMLWHHINGERERERERGGAPDAEG